MKNDVRPYSRHVYVAINKVNRHYYQRRREAILEICSCDQFLGNLLFGVYCIESTFRPLLFRLCEYGVLIFRITMCLLLGLSFPNYTIGKCQVGLANILRFNGYNVYSHTNHIHSLTIPQARCILAAFREKRNIEIAAFILTEIIEDQGMQETSFSIIKIGQAYNGKYEYGILLSKFVSLLEDYRFYGTIS